MSNRREPPGNLLRSKKSFLRFSPMAVLLVLMANSIAWAEVVVWKPLDRPVREVDTLFLPELDSAEQIERSGGFLGGHHNETTKDVAPLYEFGPGRFGPAVRVKKAVTKHHWEFYPLDGLIPGDEFTIEFSARSDVPWSQQPGTAFLTLNSVENRLELRHQDDRLELRLRWPEGQAKWDARVDELDVKQNQWHSFPVTLKDQTVRLYVDGREQAVLQEVAFHPLWSEGISSSGILLGGAPWQSSTVWISDLRISRTARVPGQAVRKLPGITDLPD